MEWLGESGLTVSNDTPFRLTLYFSNALTAVSENSQPRSFLLVQPSTFNPLLSNLSDRPMLVLDPSSSRTIKVEVILERARAEMPSRRVTTGEG